MLSKKYRIPKSLIALTIKRGFSVYTTNLTLKYLPYKTEIPLFAFIIPKKVSKRAVVRNKLKRRVKAVIKNILNNIKDNHSYVIMFKPSVNELNFNDLEKELTELFNKISK